MPSLKNVWVNPQTRVLEDDGERAIIEVSGMLCEWGWARNVKAALAGLDGVALVEHEPGTDVFVVKHEGALNHAGRAVDRVAILKWVRRALEKLGSRIQG